MRNKPIVFSEFRHYLQGLGFAAKRAETAWIFHHPTEGLLVFRLYEELEPVDERDLRTTRRFLDLRGIQEAKDFDAIVQQASTPA